MSSPATIIDALQERAELTPDQPAFIFRDKHFRRSVLSWQRLYHLAGNFAGELRTKSLGRGDLVVNTLPNSPERVVSDTGIFLSGAASVNCQCLLADGSDLMHVLKKSRASAIVLDPDVVNSPWNTLQKHVEVKNGGSVASQELPSLKDIFFVQRNEQNGDVDFLQRLQASKDWYRVRDVVPDDVCVVFTTSGTTGFSKLVVYTHGSLSAFLKLLRPKEPQMELVLSPLGWINGFVGTVFVLGTPRVLCDVRGGGVPDDLVEFVWRVAQEERPPKVSIVPAVLMPLAERVKRQRDEHDAKKNGENSGDALTWEWEPDLIGLGGQPLTRGMIQAARSLAKAVVLGYGATDFLLVSLGLVSDANTFTDHDSGPVLPGVQVKIVTQEDESVSLPVGKVGSILVKHPYMMKEYLNDPAATSAAFTEDGYLRTGDIGCLDERGHLLVDGRIGDAIVRGVYIFYPGWLQARISACPGVLDVVVVGVPDPVLNEELCACVVLASGYVTTEHVREFVEKDVVVSEDDPLSPRPRYYLRFESFPLTSTDKPLRKVIKEQAAARVSASSGSV
nr:hypothetical protein BaRGS_008612 [Batillaria attramentaria]